MPITSKTVKFEPTPAKPPVQPPPPAMRPHGIPDGFPSYLDTSMMMLYDAGFIGKAEYIEEEVNNPGGKWTNYLVKLTNSTGTITEQFIAHLFARYPGVTINEAIRLGLIEGPPRA